jgi:anti-sigma factor ChrR (cupin superfamily)
MNKSKMAPLGLMTNSPWGIAGISLALLFVAFACWTASTAWSQHADHKVVMPADLKWQEVPSLPKGAMIAVIEGPMDQAVPFTARLKVPANYKIPPHWHPAIERVTVLSGTLHMALGDKFDKAKTTALDIGGMMIIQPKTNHFVWTETESVVQLHGTGPWGITYVNPEDDPRKK